MGLIWKKSSEEIRNDLRNESLDFKGGVQDQLEYFGGFTHTEFLTGSFKILAATAANQRAGHEVKETADGK